MKKTKQNVLNEMKASFKHDYEIMHMQANEIAEGKTNGYTTVSIEDFRQAGIAYINKLYKK